MLSIVKRLLSAVLLFLKKQQQRHFLYNVLLRGWRVEAIMIHLYFYKTFLHILKQLFLPISIAFIAKKYAHTTFVLCKLYCPSEFTNWFILVFIMCIYIKEERAAICVRGKHKTKKKVFIFGMTQKRSKLDLTQLYVWTEIFSRSAFCNCVEKDFSLPLLLFWKQRKGKSISRDSVS